jgi:hypothetical protein
MDLKRFTATIHYIANNNMDVIVSAAEPKPVHTHGNITIPSDLYMILISDMWADRNNQTTLFNFKLINNEYRITQQIIHILLQPVV